MVVLLQRTFIMQDMHSMFLLGAQGFPGRWLLMVRLQHCLKATEGKWESSGKLCFTARDSFQDKVII